MGRCCTAAGAQLELELELGFMLELELRYLGTPVLQDLILIGAGIGEG